MFITSGVLSLQVKACANGICCAVATTMLPKKSTQALYCPQVQPIANDFLGRTFKAETWGMFLIPAGEIRNTNQGSLSQFVPAYK